MSDLADRVIRANEVKEKRIDDSAPEGYYTDDLGMWVENDIRRSADRFAKYLFVRCRMCNKHLYYDTDSLTVFNRHKEIRPTVRDIVELTNLPDMITPAQAIWVYNRLRETVPRLDKSRVVVAPGLAWDFKRGELVEVKGKYYTVGGNDEQ